MQSKQHGVTISGLLVWLVVFIVVALLAMRLVPAYMEYGSAKNAIEAIARDRGVSTPADARRAFEARAAIDDITVVRGADLQVTRQGNETVISFAYRREVPLFANVGIYMDFAASTAQ